jgi:hypothetical protein
LYLADTTEIAQAEPEPIKQAETPQASLQTATVSISEVEAKEFIYMKESNNNQYAINTTSGACGLGQALPCSKMGCDLSDYNCQDNWFTNYALSRYGSWVNAYNYWISNKWW